MSRLITKWALVLAVTAMLGVGTVQAQFMPGFRPGIHWQNPITGQQFSYNFNFNTALRYQHVNPFNGRVTLLNYQTTWTGLPPSLLYPQRIYNPYGLTATPYLSGGAGTYYNSNSLANPFVRKQVRMFAAAGDTNQGPEQRGGGQQVIADQFNYEKRGPGLPDAVIPANLNKNLLEPSEETILSGQALNGLVDAIRDLEAKGSKADSPLVPAELLVHINLSSGPNADVLVVMRGGKLTMPKILDAPEQKALRERLEADLAPVVTAISSSKRADAAAVDRLMTTIKKVRADLAPAIRKATVQDGTAVIRFLNGLDALAKSARDPSVTGLFPPKWSTVGASVSELVQHMTKFHLAFTPATAGSEEEYHSLHRGFVSYYVSLSQARR